MELKMRKTGHFSVARLGACLAGAALCMMTTTANAVVLVEHLPNPLLAYQSSLGAGTQNADFTFTGNASIEGISWWGAFVPDTDLASFDIRILSGLGLPDSMTVVSSSGTTRVSESNYYRFDLDLSGAPLSLASGNYYLSIMNDYVPIGSQIGWEWLTGTGGDGVNHFRAADGDVWTEDQSGDFSLRLVGTPQQTVPEPDTIALTLLAGAALLIARRRAGQAR
jgi:hypothetical protein